MEQEVQKALEHFGIYEDLEKLADEVFALKKARKILYTQAGRQ